MEYKGLHAYRLKQNSLEKRYAMAWEKINRDAMGNTDSILKYILAEDNNHPKFGEVTERDKVVAATIIQWLGSPVGQTLVNAVLELPQ